MYPARKGFCLSQSVLLQETLLGGNRFAMLQWIKPFLLRCGATTRKILRQKTGFVYEGLKRDEYMENVDEFDEFRTQSKRQSRGEQRAERIEINPQELLDHFRVLYLHDKEMLGKGNNKYKAVQLYNWKMYSCIVQCTTVKLLDNFRVLYIHDKQIC